MTSIIKHGKWELEPHEYEFLTRELHHCNTDLIFLANVIQFEVEFGAFCESVMTTYMDSLKVHGEESASQDMQCRSLLQHLAYCTTDAKFRQSQTQSLRMRVQSQINLVRLENLTSQNGSL